MIRFFIALNAAFRAPLSPAEAADAAVQLTQGERAAGYAVLLEDEDGEQVEIVGDFDLIRAERRWA